MKRYKVIITDRAGVDAVAARDYYNSIQPGLGTRFLKLFHQKIKVIGIAPFAHAIRYKNIRFAQLDTFPYVVHYFVDEANPQAVVIALHHQKDNPERWLSYTT